jgi:hypothetical protein
MKEVIPSKGTSKEASRQVYFEIKLSLHFVTWVAAAVQRYVAHMTHILRPQKHP